MSDCFKHAGSRRITKPESPSGSWLAELVVAAEVQPRRAAHLQHALPWGPTVLVLTTVLSVTVQGIAVPRTALVDC